MIDKKTKAAFDSLAPDRIEIRIKGDRNSARRIKTRIGNLIKQLSGDAREDRFGKMLKALLTKNLMVLIYNDFIQKASNEPDRFGEKWRELSDDYMAYGKKSLRKGIQFPGPHRRPTLTPEQNAIWLETVHLGGFDAAWRAAEAAGAWLLKNEMPKRDHLINVESGDLMRSIEPGKVRDDTYFPPENQKVSVTPTGVRIKLKLPYAKYVHDIRPLLPNEASDRRELLREAFAPAMRTVLRAFIESLDKEHVG